MKIRFHGMARYAVRLAIPLVIAALMGGQAGAEIKTHPLGTMEIPSPAIDLAISPDGQTMVVLTGESILILSADGTPKGTIPLDAPADSVAVSPRGDALLLGSKGSSVVRMIALEYVVQISIEGAPFKGPQDAAIVITVFTDFECPYCVALEPLLLQVMEKYPNQLRLVYKSFPLSIHPFARKAAMAAMAADRQGKFWPVHDAFFKAGGPLSDEIIKTAVKDAGLDVAKFDADLADPAVAGRVDADVRDGQVAGVRGTPTVFINGRQLTGRTIEGFSRVIDTLLAAQTKK